MINIYALLGTVLVGILFELINIGFKLDKIIKRFCPDQPHTELG